MAGNSWRCSTLPTTVAAFCRSTSTRPPAASWSFHPAAGQVTLGGGSTPHPRARHRAHPPQLAKGPHRAAWRWPLRPARGPGLVRGQRHRLRLRPRPQPGARRDDRRAGHGGGASASAHWQPRQAPALRQPALRGTQLASATPGHRPPQSLRRRQRHPLRRHQSRRQSQGALRAALLRAGPDGEPDQGTQDPSGCGPHLMP